MKLDILSTRASLLEDGLKVFNDALKTVDVPMKEIDDANARINRRGEEIKEINEVMKNLVLKTSRLEDRMQMFEREALEREEMIASLQAEVDSLQTKICRCNDATSRPLSGNSS